MTGGVSPKTYIAVWLALVASAVIETWFVMAGIPVNTLAFVMSVAVFQAALIALFFQHLREESGAVKGMSLGGLALVVVLIVAAVTSVISCTPYFPQ